MTPAASYRGQPLVVLGLLIGGWVAGRMIVLEAERGASVPAKPVASARVREERVPSPQFAAPVRPPLTAETVVPYAAPAALLPLRAPAVLIPPAMRTLEPMRPAPLPAPPPAPVPVQV
ncbi:MAG TPA: hypothetical protein VF481_18635, partial [Novosphingobium sp.]